MLYFLFLLDLSGMEYLAFLVAYLLAMVIAIVGHEFSHAFVAYRFGDITPKVKGRLTLNPLAHFDILGVISFLLIGFGWAKPVEINPLKFRNYKVGMSLVSLSGITMNLILAFMFSAFNFFFGAQMMASSNLFMNFLGYLCSLGFYLNISLFIFNLFPIYPLDGFNFIRTFLSYNNKFVNWMFRYGPMLLLVFIILPTFDFIYAYTTDGLLYAFNWFWNLFV